MKVIDFLLYCFYRFCEATRGHSPKSLTTGGIAFIITLNLTCLCEVVAKSVFGFSLKDAFNVPLWTVIIFGIIMILLYMRIGKGGRKLDEMGNHFKQCTFHQTWFYVIVSLGMILGTILVGLLTSLYVS